MITANVAWKTSALVILLAGLSSCGFVYRNTVGVFTGSEEQTAFASPSPKDESKSSLNLPASTEISDTAELGNEKLAPEASSSKVEVLWEIPKEPVDGFILRYGYTRDSITMEAKVAAASLERFEDPHYGYVYRYYLRGVPENKSVFVSLTAFNGDKLSAPSSVFEVKSESH